MSENGIEQAERRVREMNMVARQFNEQGNKFMRQTRTPQFSGNSPSQNRQQTPSAPRTRFETMGNNSPAQPTQQTRQAQQMQTVQQSVTYNGGAGRQTNVPKTQVREPEPVRIPEAKEPPRESSPADTLLSGLNIDGEKLLILLIICLLIKEKADTKLILALGYLLM